MAQKHAYTNPHLELVKRSGNRFRSWLKNAKNVHVQCVECTLVNQTLAHVRAHIYESRLFMRSNQMMVIKMANAKSDWRFLIYFTFYYLTTLYVFMRACVCFFCRKSKKIRPENFNNNVHVRPFRVLQSFFIALFHPNEKKERREKTVSTIDWQAKHTGKLCLVECCKWYCCQLFCAAETETTRKHSRFEYSFRVERIRKSVLFLQLISVKYVYAINVYDKNIEC